MEPDKFIVVVVQFLNDGIEEKLQYEMQKYEQFANGNIPLEIYNPTTKQELFSLFEMLIQKIVNENCYFILQINAHGCEMGIAANPSPKSHEYILWNELFIFTRQINEKFDGQLIMLLAVCMGNTMIGCIDPSLRAPFKYIMGSFESVTIKNAIDGFREFYNKPFPDVKFVRDCAKRMNKAVGKETSPLFYEFYDSTCFDAICNPDRDPKFFQEMVYKYVLAKTVLKTTKIKSFCELVETVDKELRGLLEITRSNRNYFLFKS
ncbi:hypothetical protein [uncultured Bacteroides sp.]|uniref:hypothetical protein n=1 Tax=uncultured Bacteroides sp. TaxID=162156 RepID=UPI00258597C3|nr:hypothetical protein [uncultured Bacteroides sp.]